MIDLTKLAVDVQLGAGSQGKVFRATDPEGARFTVKLVALNEDADRKLIFDRATAFRPGQLDQAIVPILSHGMVSNTPLELARQLGKMSRDALLLVTPFVAGTTLAEVEARGTLSLVEAVAALTGIATALSKLPAGVGHGDLRAPNIFIRTSGEIALADPDLSSNPDPADDVRALAAIALNLAKLAPPNANASAVTKLKGLIEEIARPGIATAAAEAATRFGEIAVILGAPSSNVTSVLAKQANAPEIAPASKPVFDDTARLSLGRGRQWAAGAIAVLLALAGGAWFVGHRTRRPEPIPPDQGAAESAPSGGDALYDTTGTVHYAEPVHQLKPSEHVAANDGIVHLDFESSIPRVAILSARKDVLWELRRPPAGGSAILDAKPGHYYVEQDRDLGAAGVQQDLRLVEIDFQHPLGVTTTKRILNSPQRPGQ